MTHRAAAQQMAEQCLCFRARRVSRLITRMYDEALRPLGLQATQLTLLNAIAMFGASGAGMRRLADVLAMDPTTLSRNLRPLEKAGMIELRRAEADRRVRIARLTAEGERRVEEALPLWNEAHERMVRTLGAEEALALRDRFDATVRAAGQALRTQDEPEEGE